MKVISVKFYCEKCEKIFDLNYDAPVEDINLEDVECPFCNEEPDTYEDRVIEKTNKY